MSPDSQVVPRPLAVSSKSLPFKKGYIVSLVFFSHGFLSDLLKLVSRSKTHSLQTLPKTYDYNLAMLKDSIF